MAENPPCFLTSRQYADHPLVTFDWLILILSLCSLSVQSGNTSPRTRRHRRKGRLTIQIFFLEYSLLLKGCRSNPTEHENLFYSKNISFRLTYGAIGPSHPCNIFDTSFKPRFEGFTYHVFPFLFNRYWGLVQSLRALFLVFGAHARTTCQKLVRISEFNSILSC